MFDFGFAHCYDANSRYSIFGACNLNSEDLGGSVRSRICLQYGGMTNLLCCDHFSISDPKRVGTTCNFFMVFFMAVACIVRTLGAGHVRDSHTIYTLWWDVPGGSWKPRNALDDKYFFLMENLEAFAPILSPCPILIL